MQQHGECFSNWETIVTQIEKQIESQPSFNKGSGGPKNKEQNFSAHLHNIDVAYISNVYYNNDDSFADIWWGTS